MAAKGSAAEELDVDGVKVRLTSPDKVYFPKPGKKGTNRNLVDYYLAVAGGPMRSTGRPAASRSRRLPT